MLQEKHLLDCIKANKEVMNLLSIIENLQLEQGCLCAGAIRNTLWNELSGQKSQLLSDVDVIFFDENISYEKTLDIEKHLLKEYPDYQWEVRNQVHMHTHNKGTAPYMSVEDALSKFSERCTAIAVRKREEQLEVIAPLGVADIFDFVVRPTPHFLESPQRIAMYQKRQHKKQWQKQWPSLYIQNMGEGNES